jgi:hypothetical protein
MLAGLCLALASPLSAQALRLNVRLPAFSAAPLGHPKLQLQDTPSSWVPEVQGRAVGVLKAVLPDGREIPPDSYLGGFHGTETTPAEVVKSGGFTARGVEEDRRLQEHAEGRSQPVSAFRGTTPFVASAEKDAGAAYWADEGGWVYEIQGVPTWDVNKDLEGRVLGGNGLYRGNLMRAEVEQAVPARVPIECIVRWGRVVNRSGHLLVPVDSWVPNPRYDALRCRQSWGA